MVINTSGKQPGIYDVGAPRLGVEGVCKCAASDSHKNLTPLVTLSTTNSKWRPPPLYHSQPSRRFDEEAASEIGVGPTKYGAHPSESQNFEIETLHSHLYFTAISDGGMLESS